MGEIWFLEEVSYDGILVERAVLVIVEGEMVCKGGGYFKFRCAFGAGILGCADRFFAEKLFL